MADPHVRELLKRAPTTRDWRDDSVSVPGAVDLEGKEGVGNVDAAKVSARRVWFVGCHKEITEGCLIPSPVTA